VPRTRHPYPSDLTDQEWALLEPLLASSEGRGRPPKWPARRVADAVFYLLRSGCSWRMLPHEYPPWQTVYYHFRKWRMDGRLRRAHDRLREAVREAEGRDQNPSVAVIDSQVVKTTPVGGPERGYDGAKRVWPDASATSWWTRAASSWRRGSTAPTYPIGTEGDDC
jgi:putative transposase